MESAAISEYTDGKAAGVERCRPEVRCVFRRDSGSLTCDVPPSETSRWRAVVRVLRSPVDSLSCALLPSSCALCGSSLPHLSSAPVCDVCWTEFPALSGNLCARCGDSLDAPVQAGPTSSGQCRACRMAPPPFVRAVAYGPYEGRMREAIHALKYDRLHSAARGMGRMLAVAIAQLADKAPTEMLVVPVPLHRSKYAERGFNQARSLAFHALDALGKSHPAWRLTLASSTLMRLRVTESQFGLTPRQRRLNVKGAFEVSDPAAVTQKHVLVIDDIFTTGATARATALALIGAGASSVWVATLARAGRVRDSRRAVSARFDDAEVIAGMPGLVSATASLQASFDSSHEQSSF
jgi:ComF family protein